MNKASLYYHFDNKLALDEEAIKYIRHRHMVTVNGQLEQLDTVEERIICILKNEFYFWRHIAVDYTMRMEVKEETKNRVVSFDSFKVASQMVMVCQDLLLVKGTWLVIIRIRNTHINTD